MTEVTCFDFVNEKWSQGPSMLKRRCAHSCCILHGVMYAFAGFNYDGKRNDMERLNIRRGDEQWEIMNLNTGGN